MRSPEPPSPLSPRRHDRWVDGPRSSHSSGFSSGFLSSSMSASSSSSRNPVKVAARAISSCFGSTETRSELFAPRTPSLSPARSSAGSPKRSPQGNEKRQSIQRIYGDRKSPSRSEPGGIRFTMAEIEKGTRNFSPSLKIGQGGSGTVYKARLDDGTVVAVKRAKKNGYDKHLAAEFRNEIQTLACIEHLNLVRLHGFVETEVERVMVVEYVSNGTLRDHLDCQRGKPLDLAPRLDIAIDVAHAVTYLHMYSDHPVIHRDIKSSNILLTDNLRAKVADFGFARLGSTEVDVTHVTTQVKGTAGYLDPEYLRTFQLTEKSDVYSFGVLLVELVTGRRPIEPRRELKERLTPKWAMKKFSEGNASQILDPNIQADPAIMLAVEQILELALQCLAPTKGSRPTMQRCAEILWAIRKIYREYLSSAPMPGT